MCNTVNLEDLYISPSASLVEALNKLDRTAKKILLVVDEDDRLLGTLSDGDVRRCILREGDLGTAVAHAYNAHPVTVQRSRMASTQTLMDEKAVVAIPVISEDGVVLDCVFRDGGNLRKRHKPEVDYPVIMMAGGLGSRLYPYTKILPKPLIPVNDVPIAERIIDRFYDEGCRRFILVVNYKREMIKAYFRDLDKEYSVEFVDEEVFLGTGGGLKLVEDHIAGPFVLTNCDILIDTNIAEAIGFHEENGFAVTILASLKNYTIPYGTIEIDAGGSLVGMREKPNLSFLINTGCYIVNKEVLDFIGHNEEIGFPDVILRCQAAGLKAGVYPMSEGSWLDMGQFDELRHMAEVLDAPNV